MEADTNAWIIDIFDVARQEGGKAVAAERGRLASASALNNSRSVFTTVDAWLAVGDRAILRCLRGIENRFTPRSPEWLNALDAVDEQLANFLLTAPLIATKRDEFREVASRHAASAGKALHLRVSEFRAGWTSKPADAWHVRHPILYGAIASTAGLVAGALLNAAVDIWKTEDCGLKPTTTNALER